MGYPTFEQPDDDVWIRAARAAMQAGAADREFIYQDCKFFGLNGKQIQFLFADWVKRNPGQPVPEK